MRTRALNMKYQRLKKTLPYYQLRRFQFVIADCPSESEDHVLFVFNLTISGEVLGWEDHAHGIPGRVSSCAWRRYCRW